MLHDILFYLISFGLNFEESWITYSTIYVSELLPKLSDIWVWGFVLEAEEALLASSHSQR